MRKTKFFVLGGVFTLILLTMLIGAYSFTANPSFCELCHEISTKVAYWRHSEHAEFDCMECHAKPGTVGKIMTHIAGLKEAYLHTTGLYVIPIRTEVEDDVCLRCHRGIKNTTRVGDIVMVHGKHLAEEVNCTDCHVGLVHRDPLSLSTSPTEGDCVVCHQEKDVSIECATCHLRPVTLGPRR